MQVYNPFSVTQLATDLYQRAPFPNAIIPNPNPYTVHMYSFYPSPNRTPDDPTNLNNYASSEVNTVRRHTLNNRIDFKHGKHSIYGSGGFDYGDVSQPRPFGTAGFNDAPTITKDRNPYGQIGDTIVISPTLLLDVRYGATRIIALNLGGNRTASPITPPSAFPRARRRSLPVTARRPSSCPTASAAEAEAAATGPASRPASSSISRSTNSVTR